MPWGRPRISRCTPAHALSQNPAKSAVTAIGRPAGFGNGDGTPTHNERYGVNDAAVSHEAALYAWLVKRESPGE